jgi:hypothetical protein
LHAKEEREKGEDGEADGWDQDVSERKKERGMGDGPPMESGEWPMGNGGGAADGKRPMWSGGWPMWASGGSADGKQRSADVVSWAGPMGLASLLFSLSLFYFFFKSTQFYLNSNGI